MDESSITKAANEMKNKNSAVIRNLLCVSFICVLFMVAEIVGGYLANSLAIMTDAAHLLSDLLGFVISVIALLIGQRDPTKQLSFGYARAEIIGALWVRWIVGKVDHLWK